ncbi:MAG TPA: adenylate/guanylate cyclase domain-containing protein [Acidimicrobiales bacterium]|nr:adenylate/guanylate cyclase domain-containing protein [Acidimicrobiales bacterium]
MDPRRAERARTAGASTVGSLRRVLARKAAELIRNDPEEAARALEMGIVDRRWLERPGEHPLSTAAPAEIVERFLERSVEQKPSRLASLGLNALQLLATHRAADSSNPKLLAVAFTDLEGFTAFTDSHGDAAAVQLIEEHRQLAGPVVRQWSGKILKTLGDGLLCTFPDAETGVRAALELLETAPAPLRLRAGVHVGEAVVSKGDVMGHVVNVAARVTETASGGEVVVSAEAAARLGDIPNLRFGKMKSRRLKGVSERVGVCTVTEVPIPAIESG